MKSFKVALMQLMPGGSAEENLEIGINACRKAKEAAADLALFPEMWSCGYEIPDSDENLLRLSVDADGSFVNGFRQEAKRLKMAIGVTYLEKRRPAPSNSMQIFDRNGSSVLRYSKVHTCDFDVERRLTAGEEFVVGELDTGRGSVKIGAMICYDREFPESARILMLKGAEVIAVPNACPMEINRISQLRARAFENMLGVATANYPAGKPDCNGHSTAFDGIAYREGCAGSRDTLIIEAGEREGIYIADFPIDEMRRYRAAEVHGNAYRRPGLYSSLVEKEVLPPFVRPDGRR